METKQIDQSRTNAAINNGAQKAPAPVIVNELLESWNKKNPKQLLSYLTPKEVSRLIQSVVDATRQVPQLANCTPSSLISAVLSCAQYGLYCGVSQEAAIVPYNNRKKGIIEAQFQPMYKGLIKLCYNSGFMAGITAEAVREGDYFEYQKGTTQYLIHRPNPESEDAPITHFYAVIHKTSGMLPDFKVMTIKQVNAFRKDTDPWRNYFVPQGQKTVLKQALKLIPKSIELSELLKLDDTIEAPELNLGSVDRKPDIDFGDYSVEQTPLDNQPETKEATDSGASSTFEPQDPSKS